MKVRQCYSVTEKSELSQLVFRISSRVEREQKLGTSERESSSIKRGNKMRFKAENIFVD